DSTDWIINQWSGTLTVTAPHAPTLTQTRTSGSSMPKNQVYWVTVAAVDADGDLTNVDLNWNDGTAVEHKTVSGAQASVTFSRSYSTARTINWSSTAYDSAGLASNQLSGTFNVTAPHAPTDRKSVAYGSSACGPTHQAYSITVNAAEVGGNLTHADLNWNDGTAVEHKTVSGAQASVTFSRSYSTARTINWSSTAYDSAGLGSNQLSGTFNVTAPHAP